VVSKKFSHRGIHAESRRAALFETTSRKATAVRSQDRRRYCEPFMAKLDTHDTAGLTRDAISAGIIKRSVQVAMV
jgi:hypothetical protein